MNIGKIGLVALAFAFLASGIMNLVQPGRSWKPPASDPARQPPAELLRRTRIMGAVWTVLGLLVAAYAVKAILYGY